MYPWKAQLSKWAENTGLHVDALGLLTLLGADEIDASIGRLVKSPFVDYLPLLGAYVIANNRFTRKTPGFTLYNVSSGITTTELAGWFSRWLKAQNFHQIHDKVIWSVEKQPPRTIDLFGCLLLAFPITGFLIAFTILSADWWGFANALAMAISVVVRWFLVRQNRAAIDKVILDANLKASGAVETKNQIKPKQGPPDSKTEHTISSSKSASAEVSNLEWPMEKLVVIMDDSKVVTMIVPTHLIAKVFASNPTPPSPRLYAVFRWIGWLAFGVHAVSIGMASLVTQIYTVILLVVATMLAVFKFGCDDSRIWEDVKELYYEFQQKLRGHNRNATRASCKYRATSNPRECWITSTLKASRFEYPECYEDCETNEVPRDQWEVVKNDWLPGEDDDRYSTKEPQGIATLSEKTMSITGKHRSEHRQDLWVWLNLHPRELDSMVKWDLFPHDNERNEDWWAKFYAKRQCYTNRLRKDAQKRHDNAMSGSEACYLPEHGSDYAGDEYV